MQRRGVTVLVSTAKQNTHTHTQKSRGFLFFISWFQQTLTNNSLTLPLHHRFVPSPQKRKGGHEVQEQVHVDTRQKKTPFFLQLYFSKRELIKNVVVYCLETYTFTYIEEVRFIVLSLPLCCYVFEWNTHILTKTLFFFFLLSHLFHSEAAVCSTL